MKLLFDLLPLLLFFVAYKFADIYTATGVAIAASVLQLGYLVVRRKKIEFTHWLNVIIIVVFGGATLFFHNETFIKWKPTVLYWMFAAALVVSQTFFRRNLIQSMLNQQVELPESVWQRLNLAWIAFFAVIGMLNIYVAYTYPTPVWVNFKVFGILGLMVAFILAQSVYLSRYIKEE